MHLEQLEHVFGRILKSGITINVVGSVFVSPAPSARRFSGAHEIETFPAPCLVDFNAVIKSSEVFRGNLGKCPTFFSF